MKEIKRYPNTQMNTGASDSQWFSINRNKTQFDKLPISCFAQQLYSTRQVMHSTLNNFCSVNICFFNKIDTAVLEKKNVLNFFS